MRVLIVILLSCELCAPIRVPVVWDDSESEDKPQNEDSGELVVTQPFEEEIITEKPIPPEYFEYKAKKPQFAVDNAAYHGMQSPENYYKAYEIKPIGREKPTFGKHNIFNNENRLHKEFQDYESSANNGHEAAPVSSSYEVYHPYDEETFALKTIYKDPVLMKIRNDLENSKNRLQQYETDAGKPDISKEEYLEKPEQTEEKLFRPRPKAPFEIHRPQRRPIYYRAGPNHHTKERFLINRLKHPWNNIAKVRPTHYRPIQNHIKHLRQNHALKYENEGNEYPQVTFEENNSDPKDGQDIYLRGKDHFHNVRNTVDETINRAVQNNRNNNPDKYTKLEIQKDDNTSEEYDDDEDETKFVPIKNYAQVRKTETFKHLPRQSAFAEAETYDEIKNAPRLKEAVKSTKAQTVYSEEGYEDAAYDHAGEHKHASENEGHGGFLKEHSRSVGKYKAPSMSENHEDGEASAYKDQAIHASKWKDNSKEFSAQDESKEADNDEKEDYEDENERLSETDDIQDDNNRNKRENNEKFNSTHAVDKRETNFEIPEVDLNSTFFKDTDYIKLAKIKLPSAHNIVRLKYPYYFKKIKTLNINSPLKYAENLKLIPKKSNGGTEFYDSRSKLQCPEVDDVPDPVPEKLKGEGHPDGDSEESDEEDSTKGDGNFDTVKKQPRLKGLGDKIDCFKAKYFGENPLDSPFFKEGNIANPEPLKKPKIASFTLKPSTFAILDGISNNAAESKLYESYKNLKGINPNYLKTFINNLKLKTNKDLLPFTPNIVAPNLNSSNNSTVIEQQSKVYNDIISNIQNDLLPSNDLKNNDTDNIKTNLDQKQVQGNITYTHFTNKEDITKPVSSRKKRAVSLAYEPYKIIRDVILPEKVRKFSLKKNNHPQLRQSRASKSYEKDSLASVEETSQEKLHRNIKPYTDIGKHDRINYGQSKNDKNDDDSDFVVINLDGRRNEPRYEIKHKNHKPNYTPVLDTKSISKEDYEAQTNNDEESITKSKTNKSPRKIKVSTEKPYYDIEPYLPRALVKVTEFDNLKNNISSEVNPEKLINVNYDQSDSEEESEHEDEYEDEIITTTILPTFKRRKSTSTTTEEPSGYVTNPNLKLVTRFRDYKLRTPTKIESNNDHVNEKITTRDDDDIETPKIKEKKKKLSKSTIVTDAKTYGNISDSDSERMRAEVDELIGVQHDMDEYLPLYEKELRKSNETDSGEDNSEENDSQEDIDNSERDNSEEDDEEYSDEEEEDSEEDDDEEDDKEASSNNDHEHLDHKSTEVTTTEPTKRTLAVTTDMPLPTVAMRHAKILSKPTVIRKVIKIHNELPMLKASPNMSEFKQDIQEIEIIKERNPLKRKINKNAEVLNLYKDEHLAKDINNMGVEIFKENLDLRQGPKHGGNYKILEEISETAPVNVTSTKDTDTSQSKYAEETNLKAQRKERVKYKTRGRSSRLIELSDPPYSANKAMHGGNLKRRTKNYDTDDDHDQSHENLELSEERNEDDQRDFTSRGNTRMHGGNYLGPTESISSDNVNEQAMLLLSSVAQAAPVLTTSPPFIVDPSKRKYYYVDV